MVRSERSVAWSALSASLAFTVLSFLPIIGLLAYPVEIFGTFIHEGAHALATWAVGGTVEGVAIHSDGSGVTPVHVSGGLPLLIVGLAGYLGTLLYGFVFLWATLWKGLTKYLFAGTATFIGFIGLFLGMDTWTMVSAGGLAAVLFFLVFKGRGLGFWSIFLAVQCVFNAFGDIVTLLKVNALHSGIHNDAVLVSKALGGVVPPVLCALAVAGIGTLILFKLFRAYLRTLSAH